MKREAINHVGWGANFAMNQAELVTGCERLLHFSGQTAIVEDPSSEMGLGIRSPGDMGGQIAAALSDIDALLEKAGMSRKNILTLRFFTTDVEAFLGAYDVYAGWIGEAGIMPPQTLLGVSSLALPGLLVEIEATAGD